MDNLANNMSGAVDNPNAPQTPNIPPPSPGIALNSPAPQAPGQAQAPPEQQSAPSITPSQEGLDFSKLLPVDQNTDHTHAEAHGLDFSNLAPLTPQDNAAVQPQQQPQQDQNQQQQAPMDAKGIASAFVKPMISAMQYYHDYLNNNKEISGDYQQQLANNPLFQKDTDHDMSPLDTAINTIQAAQAALGYTVAPVSAMIQKVFADPVMGALKPEDKGAGRELAKNITETGAGMLLPELAGEHVPHAPSEEAIADLRRNTPTDIQTRNAFNIPVEPDTPFGQAAQEAAGKTGVDVKNPEGPLFSKTAGEAYQDPNLQMQERDIQKGNEGTKAQNIASNFAENRTQEVQKEVAQYGRATEGGNEAENIGRIKGIISDNSNAGKLATDKAYNLARDAAKDVPLTREDMEGIIPEPNKRGDVVINDHEISPEVTPKAYKTYQNLQDILEPEEAEEGVVPEKEQLLVPLEQWRRVASRTLSKTTDPGDAAAIRQLINSYDSHMSSVIDTLPNDSGTGDAVAAYKEAVNTRKAYGEQFEGNDIVQSMLDKNGPTVDDLTKQLFGSGSIKGKSGMLDNFNAIMRASGDKAAEVKQSMRDAVAQRMYNNIQDGKLPNSNETAFSTKKMQTELNNLFVKQKEMATALYGPDAVQRANQAIAELKVMNARQPGVITPSNSGETAVRLGIKALESTPVVGWAVKFLRGAKDIVGNVKSADEASKLFSGKKP